MHTLLKLAFENLISNAIKYTSKNKENTIVEIGINENSDNAVEIYFKDNLIKKLNGLKGHKDSQNFAEELYKTEPLNIFNLTPST